MDKNENTSIRLHGIPEVDPNYEPIRPGRVSAGATEDSRPGITMRGPFLFFQNPKNTKENTGRRRKSGPASKTIWMSSIPTLCGTN